MITVIGSLKGGSGKSTVTFNLAVWLAMAQQKIQVFDLDPQATLTDVAEVRYEENFQPIIEIYDKDALTDSLKRKKIQILIDVGTADMESFKKAIALAHRIIIPVQPSQADVWSTQRFLQIVDSVHPGNKKPEILSFVNRADTHHAVRESDETAAALVALPHLKLIKRRLHQRTAYRRSFSEGLSVFEMNARSKAAQEFISLAAVLYPALLKNLIK